MTLIIGKIQYWALQQNLPDPTVPHRYTVYHTVLFRTLKRTNILITLNKYTDVVRGDRNNIAPTAQACLGWVGQL